MSNEIVPQNSTPAQRIGGELHKLGMGPRMCGNLEEIRGWLQAANGQWYQTQQASLADHERLVALIKRAAEEAQKP